MAHTRPAVVFVYGALRSGTTMFRLMLEAHPGITNPGEADFLFDHIAPDPGHPTGWRYDRTALETGRIFRAYGLRLPADKDGLDLLDEMLVQLATGDRVLTLNVHRHADRIRATLPGARFIHLIRDPRDVARSVMVMGWAGTLWRGVDFWMKTETSWDGIAGALAPDRVCPLRYEDLFQDIDGSLHRVCAFLGVPFEPAMLDYHRNSTYGPPDAALVEQWRHRSTAREVALVEAKAGDLMRARGYALSGPGHRPGPAERLRLYAVDRFRVWRFGARRFGPATYFAEKIARRIGARAWHLRLLRRMDEITIRHLK